VDRRLEFIEELVRSLESLMDAIERDSIELGSAEDPIMGACTAAFERYTTESERFAPESRSDELKQRIRHAVKLHAMVASSASREQESIGDDLAGSAGRRERRQAFKSLPEVGLSCDLSG
jgi:hypothetical protein